MAKHARAVPDRHGDRTSPAASQRLWLRILFTGLVLVALQPIFLGCNLLAQSLPREPINQHLVESQDSFLFTRAYERGHKFLGSEANYDNNRFLASIPNQHDHGDAFSTSVIATIDDSDPGHTWTWDHWRYWHGWQLFTDLCFLVGPIQVLVVATFLLMSGAVAFLLLQLRKRIGWVPALCFVLVTYLSTGVYANFLGDITMAISMAVMTYFAAGILWAGSLDSPRSPFYVSFLCVVGGACFCFVDFLTIPEFALGVTVFCALLTLDLDRVSAGRLLAQLVKFSLLFGVGFLFTWATKWGLVATVIGPGEVVSNLSSETALWTASEADTIYQEQRWQDLYLANPRLYAIFIGAYESVMNGNLAGKLGAAAAILCVLAGTFQIVRCLTFGGLRRFPGTLVRNELMLNLVTLFVPLYAFVTYMHTVWHISNFGSKCWGLVYGVLATTFLKIAIDLARARRREREEATEGRADGIRGPGRVVAAHGGSPLTVPDKALPVRPMEAAPSASMPEAPGGTASHAARPEATRRVRR